MPGGEGREGEQGEGASKDGKPMLTRICAVDDLWSGEMRALELEGRKVLLVRAGGAINAYPDRCLHQGVALSTGRLDGCVLTCSAHEWQYDICTGRGINPAELALPRFPLEIRDGGIWIDVEAGPSKR